MFRDTWFDFDHAAHRIETAVWSVKLSMGVIADVALGPRRRHSVWTARWHRRCTWRAARADRLHFSPILSPTLHWWRACFRYYHTAAHTVRKQRMSIRSLTSYAKCWRKTTCSDTLILDLSNLPHIISEVCS